MAEEGVDAGDSTLGVVKQRKCRDSCCLFLFAIHWALFLLVIFIGLRDGDPKKLYKPRDFSGSYCGVQPNLTSFSKHVLMMNVSVTVGSVAEQLVCSSTASRALAGLMNRSDYDAYLCACCLVPCARCVSSLKVTDLSNPASLQGVISQRMSELTAQSAGSQLFSPSSSNAKYFSSSEVWAEVTKYFVAVCVSGTCEIPNITLLADTRNYTYSPPPDLPWKKAWDALATDARSPAEIRSLVASKFTFRALPARLCPYHPRYCVPFPGVDFVEAGADYCSPKLEAGVVATIGGGMSSSLQSSGLTSLAESSSPDFGAAMGNLFQSLDTLGAVAFWSFVIGLLFITMMRFLVGVMTWCALLSVILILAAGGGVAFIRSGQCSGAGFLDTGKAGATAVAAALQYSVSEAFTEAPSEALTGNGADYRGAQMRTRSGRTCQAWGSQTPHAHSWTLANYPNAGLSQNYCRNPSNASSIWCFTTELEKTWELCSPIGVIEPECPNGYEVATERGRFGLRVCAYLVWALGGVWLLLILLLRWRIRLAIAINKVAAMFIYHTPLVVTVPIVQAAVGICWCVGWIAAVSFLLSQVPEGYTPTTPFATYAEAYGTSTTPGACTNKWPEGFVWRDEGDPTLPSHPCSGTYGNVTGITPHCWRCGQPRYAFDARFVYAFFSLLWNNALLMATGQCIIALACAMWFFTPTSTKGVERPSVLRAAYTVFRYHLGSLIFGSLILAIVQLVRYCLLYFEKQARAQKNRVMAVVLRVVRCCVWCFEKCLKFLNRNAYIQIAIRGGSFCSSAKHAFAVITQNALRFGVLALLGRIIHIIGFTFIMVSTALTGYFVLQAMHPEVQPVLPVICYFVVGFLVAELYMSVFSMGVDTSLQCFIEAEQHKDGAAYVPGPLKDFIATEAPASKRRLVTAKVEQVAPEAG